MAHLTHVCLSTLSDSFTKENYHEITDDYLIYKTIRGKKRTVDVADLYSLQSSGQTELYYKGRSIDSVMFWIVWIIAGSIIKADGVLDKTFS